MQGVRIVCVSDLHGCLDYDSIACAAIRRKANILAIAGDIQNADMFRHPRSYFEADFLGMVSHLRDNGIEVVATPGNHDFYIRSLLEGGKIDGCPNILVDEGVTIHGVKFWCTPWVPTINGQWAYEDDDRNLAEKFAKIPDDIDVLISHTPPLGGSCDGYDVSLDFRVERRRHFGSDALRMAIMEKRPKALVCGHIHSGDHSLSKVADTAILNCSLLDERYGEAYKPSEIMVSKKGMKFRTNGSRKWQELQ